jgi:hypothetical protein
MVLAVRLKKFQEQRLGMVSRRRHLNKSEAAKELLDRGFVMYLLEEYGAGNVSIGTLAENLDIPVVEALNLAAKFNVHPDIPRDFLVEAWANAQGLSRRKAA